MDTLLTTDQINQLIDIIRTGCGGGLTKPDFANALLELLEDVPMHMPMGSLDEIELVNLTYPIYINNQTME